MCKIQISKWPIVHWARAAVVLLVKLRKNGYILSICTAARISFFFDFFRLFNFNHKTLLFPPFKSFLNVKRWAGWSLHANRIKAVIVNIRKINTQFTRMMRTLELRLNKNTPSSILRAYVILHTQHCWLSFAAETAEIHSSVRSFLSLLLYEINFQKLSLNL